MNPERWARVEALFERAKALPESEWPLFLANEAADDIELVDLVLSMLRARAGSNFIDPPGSGPHAPPSGPDLWIGRKLGDFELVERIGAGGMGLVYKARQLSLRRDVAVKVLPFQTLSSPNQVARFERESQIAGRLHHKNLVEIHAVGQDGDVHWFAMELVDGVDLSAEIKRLRGEREARGGRPGLLPFDSKEFLGAVAALMVQAADGLVCAHAAGVVHRDIKPSNLLLDRAGTIRIVDFGLARDEVSDRLTKSGEQLGTAHYMSPEQVRRRAHRVDERTDIYSLGVVLYELLTLRRPFNGKTSAEIWWSITHHEPRSLRKVAPRVPRDLATICETAMARRLFDRYQSAAAFRDDLQRFIDREAIAAKPLPLHRRAGRFVGKHRALFAGAAVALLALALAGGIGGSRWSHRQRRIDAWLQQFQVALDLRDWSGLPEPGAAARRALVEMDQGSVDLGASGRQLADQLRRRLEVHRSFELERGRALLAGGKADHQRWKGQDREFRASFSSLQIGEALRRLGDLATIFPDDVEVVAAAAVENSFPRVTLSLAAETLAAAPLAGQARAWRRPIDDLTETVGSAIDMGPLPIDDAAVPPGHWRFVVEVPEWGFAELVRDLVPSVTTCRLVARVLAAPVAMRRIEGGTFEFRRNADSSLGCSQTAASAPFETFWIDEAELSNREFVAYLEGAQAPPPIHWSHLGYGGRDWRELPFGDGPDADGWRERWLDLPVVGLTYAEATAVAEWYGKRLPTHVELERAQRGAAGLYLPWEGLERREDAGACNVDQPLWYLIPSDLSAPKPTPTDLHRAYYRNYLRYAVPTRADGYRHGPEQLFHAFGNVAEWSSTLLLEEVEGRLEPKRFDRQVLGGGWDAMASSMTLASHVRVGIGAADVNDHTGLRCARSAAAKP